MGVYLGRGEYLKASIKATMLAYNLVLIGTGFISAYLAWQLQAADRRALSLVAVPVVVKAILHVALFATLRYQVPITPFLIIFSAFLLAHVRQVLADLIPALA